MHLFLPLFLYVYYTDEKPTLKALEGLEPIGSETIDVLEKIGIDYDQFGMQILQDDNGDAVEEIKDDENGARKIKRAIMKRWLKGKGKEPVSWRTLVEVLESVKLRELVKELQSALE